MHEWMTAAAETHGLPLQFVVAVAIATSVSLFAVAFEFPRAAGVRRQSDWNDLDRRQAPAKRVRRMDAQSPQRTLRRPQRSACTSVASLRTVPA